MANIHGPSRSPTVFETFKPVSAKAEDHWLIACSDAPEQSISTARIQKSFDLKSSFIGAEPSSAARLFIGTRQK